MSKSDSHKPHVVSVDNTPPEQLSAWERWQLPNMEAGQARRENALNYPDRRPPPDATAQAAPEPELRPLTADDLEAIRQAAYAEGLEQGRNEGHQAGYEAGYQSGEGEVKAVITRLNQICRALLEPIPSQDNELEQVLLQLVEQICQRVVQRELRLDSSGIRAVVQEAIDCLQPGSQRLRIHLNREDLAQVEQVLKEHGEWEDSWRIVAHPTITPGGCIVETDNSMVDARAERRLASVIRQVYEQQQQALEERGQQQGHVDQLLDEVDSFRGDPETDLPPISPSKPHPGPARQEHDDGSESEN
ncbi:MAG: flagellar assembly protein FliH [Pseudomonadota bacterium]|nr:flagellar assembly protein FliH [Pseudomonadota bacterium]